MFTAYIMCIVYLSHASSSFARYSFKFVPYFCHSIFKVKETELCKELERAYSKMLAIEPDYSSNSVSLLDES